MGLMTGFLTILAVIGCGAWLAHRRVLDRDGQRVLAEIAFYVATPALMLVTISEVDVGGAVANLATSATALGVTALVYAAVARWRWRQAAGEVLIGALVSSYVNAGNLGLAFAAYVVGDTAVVVPTLLVQVLVVQPFALAYLDHRSGRTGTAQTLRRMVANPLTVASLLGAVLAVTGAELPRIVLSPVELLAGLAIPAMLMSYGAALRLSPPIGRAGHSREVLLASALKLVFMPLVAYGVATVAGLDGTLLLGVVLTAALPSAQNLFLHATRYGVGEDVARETILVTTLGCVPVVLGVALLLG
jgi:malonate transporter